MAKEQDLPLNSAKISGVCGRLMCCLRYEFEAYKDFKSRAPKKKAVIDTPLGKAKIQEYDTPREQLVLRLENGKVFRVDLADMTCSDACKKRAAEQKCACRPDTVTRDVLEKIESADIALALMELDRENGVDVGDGLRTADRIVTSGPTPRRRRQQHADAPAQGAPDSGRRGFKQKGASPKADEAASAAPQRRRRKRSTAPAEGAPAPEEQRGGRRRRHHVVEGMRLPPSAPPPRAPRLARRRAPRAGAAIRHRPPSPGALRGRPGAGRRRQGDAPPPRRRRRSPRTAAGCAARGRRGGSGAEAPAPPQAAQAARRERRGRRDPGRTVRPRGLKAPPARMARPGCGYR